MKIHATSSFKNPEADHAWFTAWVKTLEKSNGRAYDRFDIATSLGNTVVWGLRASQTQLPALVIFPGARTTPLIWDFDRGLDHLGEHVRIFLVETNGQPNLSEGNTPDIKSLDYGNWAAEVFDKLRLDKAFIAGASFGGLVCMKMAITNPEKIHAIFLLNPGCLQPFSMGLSNLYHNILPLISPTEKNIRKFLGKAIFCKPTHYISSASEQMLVDYEVFAISRYTDKTQKPYFMNKELAEVKSDTYLLLGNKDLLFPCDRSLKNARKLIGSLKDVRVFENVAHGIETYDKALAYIAEKLTLKNTMV